MADVAFKIVNQSLTLSHGDGIAGGSLDVPLPRPMLRRLKMQVSNLTVTDPTGYTLA